MWRCIYPEPEACRTATDAMPSVPLLIKVLQAGRIYIVYVLPGCRTLWPCGIEIVHRPAVSRWKAVQTDAVSVTPDTARSRVQRLGTLGPGYKCISLAAGVK